MRAFQNDSSAYAEQSLLRDSIPARDEGEVLSRARVRVSKGLFLFAAGVSFALSVSLWFLGDREQGLFVGLWVPSILALGALLLSGQGDPR